MGFFDSLIKSTIRKTVNTAVDRAVDTAFDKISDQSPQPQPQPSPPVQPRVSTIARPNLTGNIYETDCFIDTDGTELTFAYELPENLYDYNSGAVDIPLAYCVAHSEDEYEDHCDELYGILPIIYFENGCSFDNALKSKNNLVFTRIEGHPLIEEKYEYDNPNSPNAHEIAYKFYLSQANKAENIPTVLVLTYSSKADRTLLPYAAQAFELIASTLTRK